MTPAPCYAHAVTTDETIGSRVRAAREAVGH